MAYSPAVAEGFSWFTLHICFGEGRPDDAKQG